MSKLMSLPAAYNGGLEYFNRHCTRYGTVTGYHDYEDDTGAPCRDIALIVQGCHVTITKRLGVVMAAQYYAD